VKQLMSEESSREWTTDKARCKKQATYISRFACASFYLQQHHRTATTTITAPTYTHTHI